MSAPAPEVSLVIPCYRDEHALPAMLERVAAAVESLGRPTELVLVDDGSPDRTGPVAVELARELPFPTTVVLMSRNFGQQPAVVAGLEQSRGRIVVTLDSDLQYPPEEIARLVDAVSEEHPVVSGYRADRRDPKLRRLMTGALSWWLSRRTGVRLRDYGSMFRAYDRRVVDDLLRFSERRRYLPALVSWLRVPVLEVEVTHAPRGEQGSRYRVAMLIDMLLDLITGYATFPLRTVAACGFLGAVLGMLASVALLGYRVVAGAGPSGLVSAFALVFFLLAVQLFLTVLLGEYVGRIYIEAKGRPYYLVRDVVRNR